MLVVIIVTLAVLCVLFATGAISFKNSDSKEKKLSNNSIVGYYQFYKEYEDNSFTAYQLELTEDGIARYCVIKANSGSSCDEGTYTVSNNKIYFDGKSVSGIAIGNPVSRTFIKENDTIYEELSKIYSMSKVGKEDLKNIFPSMENTTSVIQTKLVDNIRCQNSNTTFNDITVKVESNNNDGLCDSKITINNDDITADTRRMYVESYEFYDSNVIVLSSDTNGLPMMTIYDTKKQQNCFKGKYF